MITPNKFETDNWEDFCAMIKILMNNHYQVKVSMDCGNVYMLEYIDREEYSAASWSLFVEDGHRNAEGDWISDYYLDGESIAFIGSIDDKGEEYYGDDLK